MNKNGYRLSKRIAIMLPNIGELITYLWDAYKVLIQSFNKHCYWYS